MHEPNLHTVWIDVPIYRKKDNSYEQNLTLHPGLGEFVHNTSARLLQCNSILIFINWMTSHSKALLFVFPSFKTMLNAKISITELSRY